MSARRVRLSPVGTVAVETVSGVWIELRLYGLGGLGVLRDELRYLDPAEVADWPEYGAPAGYGALT